jgi:cellulose biosynthesis protein BcsQ
MHWEAMEKFEEMFPGKVSPAVRENVSLAEAPGRGMPVILSSPSSHGAADYQEVAGFLLRHLK